MHYLSQDTVIYRPNLHQDIVLCQYDDIMEEMVDIKSTVQLQREAVIGSPWMHQAARGNAALHMTFTVARACATAARARSWGLDLQELLTRHPEGSITWLTSYHDRRPGRSRYYHATIDLAQPYPITSDHAAGSPSLGRRPDDIRLPESGDKVWAAMQIALTLTGDIG